jgi:hypothetical protein
MSCTADDAALYFMAELPVPPMVLGDHWSGIESFTVELVTDVGPPEVTAPPAADVDRVVMEFRKTYGTDDVADVLDSDDGDITIVSANNWEFAIPPVPLSLTAGRWFFALKFWDVNGVAQTFLRGTLNVERAGVLTP